MTDLRSLPLAASREIDFWPLLRPLKPGEVMKFKRHARRAGIMYPPTPRPDLLAVLAAAGAGVVTIPLVVAEVLLLVSISTGYGPFALTATLGIGSIGTIAGCLYVIWREQPLFPLSGGQWPRRLRIAEFAGLNNFDNVAQSPAPFPAADSRALPGTEMAVDRLIARSGPALEIGNLVFHRHSWENIAEIRRGYLAMELPPRSTPALISTLQRSVDHAELGVTVSRDDHWILLHSDVAFDLLAPQTYRVLLWIAGQTDARRGAPHPISASDFIAETKRLARLREPQLGRWLMFGALGAAAVWLATAIAIYLTR